MNRFLFWSHALVAAALTAASCASPIVGAECSPGYTLCNGRCTDLSSSASHCGACGNMCSAGEVCSVGRCVLGDGGIIDDEDGAFGDGGFACDLGEQFCNGICVRPDRDPNNCNGCGIVCDVGQLCAPCPFEDETDGGVDGGMSCVGQCVDTCPPGLTPCNGQCVDTENDPLNCGGCGIRCITGVCVEGGCKASVRGHLVVVGHDYTSQAPAPAEDMQRVTGNSVFLAGGAPPKVLVYEGDADPASVAGTDNAINFVGSRIGRAWERIPSTQGTLISDAEVPFRLSRVDAFLIYAQRFATDDLLQKRGQEWRRALRTFLRRGGVVVLLDGAGNHGGTFQILTPIRMSNGPLFVASGRTDITGSTLRFVSLEDSVALGVFDETYVGVGNTVVFDTTDMPVVAEETTDRPVVIHKVVAP